MAKELNHDNSAGRDFKPVSIVFGKIQHSNAFSTVMYSGISRICCKEGQRLKLCHGALTVDFGAGCSNCSTHD